MSDKLPPKILVIEFDELLSGSICNAIERYWFDVLRVYDEESAIKTALLKLPNIVIISSRIKGVSALEMAFRIRKISRLSSVPIVFLIDEGEVAANYNPINNGFIEIIYRPFTPNQLMAAMKALLRKSQPIFSEKIIRYKDVGMNLATYRVNRGNKFIHLGPTEFKILQLFVQSPRTIYSRQQIINHVWGEGKEIEPRTVDVHINRLRTLLKFDKDDVPFIKTVRASGYCLNLPGEKE